MSGEKIAINAILCYLWKKRLSARAVTEEINDVEGPGTVKNVCRKTCSDISRKMTPFSKTKPWSWKLSVLEYKVSLEMDEQRPSTRLVGRVLWDINLCRLFNAKSIFKQIISSISNNSV